MSKAIIATCQSVSSLKCIRTVGIALDKGTYYNVILNSTLELVVSPDKTRAYTVLVVADDPLPLSSKCYTPVSGPHT